MSFSTRLIKSREHTEVTFVHQRSPYVRLEVEFTLVERANPDSMLDDVVQSLSGPYLATEAAHATEIPRAFSSNRLVGNRVSC